MTGLRQERVSDHESSFALIGVLDALLLSARPQDYVVAPEQPWLDGYCVEKGIIRQFVAMPLGAGYTAEEQITGEAEHGGMQLVVYPMKRQVFDRRFPVVKRRGRSDRVLLQACVADASELDEEMGLAPGGRMCQEIYDDPLSENESTEPKHVVHLRAGLARDQVREGSW